MKVHLFRKRMSSAISSRVFFTLEPSIPNWKSLIPWARRNFRLASGYGSGHRHLGRKRIQEPIKNGWFNRPAVGGLEGDTHRTERSRRVSRNGRLETSRNPERYTPWSTMAKLSGGTSSSSSPAAADAGSPSRRSKTAYEEDGCDMVSPSSSDSDDGDDSDAAGAGGSSWRQGGGSLRWCRASSWVATMLVAASCLIPRRRISKSDSTRGGSSFSIWWSCSSFSSGLRRGVGDRRGILIGCSMGAWKRRSPR